MIWTTHHFNCVNNLLNLDEVSKLKLLLKEDWKQMKETKSVQGIVINHSLLLTDIVMLEELYVLYSNMERIHQQFIHILFL